MTTLARRFVSEPIRTATETWKAVVDLLAPDPIISARKELLDVTGVASSLISAEAIHEDPIVVFGGGPRVRIYGLYGEDAISGEDVNESMLATFVLVGDWSVSLPCPADDLEWVQAALKSHSSRIKAREAGALVVDDGEEDSGGKSSSVNLEAFLRS